LGTDQDNLDLANVNLMLELLVQKKKQLEAVSSFFVPCILRQFEDVCRVKQAVPMIDQLCHWFGNVRYLAIPCLWSQMTILSYKSRIF